MRRLMALVIVSWIAIIIYFIYFLEGESANKEIDFIEGGDIKKAEMIDSIRLKDSVNN
jgi:hypothetical protein